MESKATKLPVWATVKAAYQLAWNNRGEYLKISRWWLMLTIPVLYLYNWLAWPSMRYFVCPDDQHKAGKLQALYLLDLPSEALVFLASASIAVAWHRLILRNEKIATHRYLRFDNAVQDYFVFGFLLYLIGIFPSLFISSIGNQSSGATILIAFLAVCVGVIALLVTVRLYVLLPAKALGLGDITTKDVWQKTRSNFWRICIGNFLCIFPVALIYKIIEPDCDNTMIGVTFYTSIQLLSILIAAPVFLSFLSLTYQHFFDKE